MTGHPIAGRTRHRPRGRRRRWLAATGYSLLVLAGLSAGVLGFLLAAPPLDAVRDRLIRQVEARTGRTLVVDGPMSVSLLPRAVVSLNGVALLPAEPAAGSAPVVAVPSIDAEMSLWSLLSRRPQLERLTLHRPEIVLAIDAQGRRNWDVEAGTRPATPVRPPATAQGAQAQLGDDAPQPPAERGGRRARPPVALNVVDGTVRFSDARTGTQHEIGAVNLEVTLDDGAVRATGRLTWQDQPLELSATVAPDARTRNGRGAREVMLALTGAPIDASYQGTLATDGPVAAVGALAIKRLAYKDRTFGPVTIGIAADGPVARLTLQDHELYGGRGNGTVTIDATDGSPAFSAQLQLAGVAMLPLLKETSGADWLDGTGTFSVALDGRGASEEEVLQSLRGRVQLAIADGGVAGLDVDRALRALQRGRLDRMAPRRGDRTPFQALTATFDIAEGIATNEDLKLTSQHVQLDGAGKIELGPRRIDYTLQTKIGSGAPAEGASVAVGTLELPVTMTGPLDRPKFSIKGQEQVTDTLKQIGRNLRSREVQEALEGLLGGDRSKRVKPADLLEKLLKKD